MSVGGCGCERERERYVDNRSRKRSEANAIETAKWQLLWGPKQPTCVNDRRCMCVRERKNEREINDWWFSASSVTKYWCSPIVRVGDFTILTVATGQRLRKKYNREKSLKIDSIFGHPLLRKLQNAGLFWRDLTHLMQYCQMEKKFAWSIRLRLSELAWVQSFNFTTFCIKPETLKEF